MDVFKYPINAKEMLRKKNSIRKELLSQNKEWIQKKIAILGGSTTDEVMAQLELFLLYNGIRPIFYQSDYNQYWQDAVFGNPKLDTFQPDIIYIHTSWRNIEIFPEIQDSFEEVSNKLEVEYKRFLTIWEALSEKFDCPIIQNNFDRPNYRLLGNRDIWDFRGRNNFLFRLNQKFYEYAQNHNNFYINDLAYISEDYGLLAWGNPIYWYMYKYALSVDAIPYLAQSLANIIKSIYGKNKKVLALDLDNTLWGGVIGDDGIEGILIGPDHPKGQAYAELQKYCKQLRQIGVVLVINSKNELESEITGLNHPDGILKQEDFVNIKANWNSKDQNLNSISEELNLGIDSFVFVDDNPVERDIISVQLPEVEVPIWENPEAVIPILDRSGYFEVTLLSSEDMQKTEMYHAKMSANKIASTFANYGEYLDNLQMSATIYDFKAIFVERIAQLTNKTNQFNLTTLRCSEEDIKAMQGNPNYICLCGHLTDKFGNNGLVTVVAGEILSSELHIRLWLMSCRVLKRDMEVAMMNVLVKKAQKKGVKKIIGYYYPTKKNGMVKNFFEMMGFQLVMNDNENTVWELEINEYRQKNAHIQIVSDTI